ncbi:probable leucine-rich repeat receptor-like protein kinase At1g35710 [Cajanus cajan]|uniref:probable leucine-rich repeat receptor-like protein kinase At1g35710 n=1 Tax=Cajanus cajan TaxID=3821 RepID=UPI00098DAA6E|nr:probable leucine-rich repeat receptor-like protein kinase At1g35710 [Cajanus cajan]
MGIVLESGVAPAPAPTPLLSPSEANAILNSGWWDLSKIDAYSSICTWVGITCNEDGSITAIIDPYVSSGNLATLDFSAFKNLESIKVTGSGLYGTIPPEIGNLRKLTHLDLSYNYLQGEIPPSLGNLIKLESLTIYSNNIQGSIPRELLFLQNLNELDLSYNYISGEIPPELGHLLSLKILNLRYNHLKGPVTICK